MRLNVYSFMHHNHISRIKIKNSTVTIKRLDSEEWLPLSLDNNPIYGCLLLTDLVLNQMGHEEFLIFYEKIPGTNEYFKGMLCVYSRDLGPAIAGLRVNSYETEEDMIEDAVMTSRTYARKVSITGLCYGGAQMVVDWETPQDVLFNHACVFPLLHHVGNIIEEYQGQVVITPDLNTSIQNMHIIRRKTAHVISTVGNKEFVPVEGRQEEEGVINGSGDPSRFTAYSVYSSLKAASAFVEQKKTVSLRGKKILVIGLGKCGLSVVDYLVQEGADVYGADIDADCCRVMEEIYGVTILGRNMQQIREVHKFPCYAIVPCAVGGIISDKRINEFETKIICGSANNQLNTDRDAVLLHERGIVYVPDFLANCGGFLNAVQEISCSCKREKNETLYRQHYDPDKVMASIQGMTSVVREVLETAVSEDLSPWEVCVAAADARLQDHRKAKWIRYFGKKLESRGGTPNPVIL